MSLFRRQSKRPPLLVRIPLKILSVLLCVVLMLSLLATALLADICILTSSGGIKKILTGLVNTTETAPVTEPAAGVHNGLVFLSDTEMPEYTVDDQGNIYDPNGNWVGNINDPGSIDLPEGIELPDNIQIPQEEMNEALAQGDVSGIVEYVYDVISESMGGDIPMTLEQVMTFVNESTFMDYLAEKVSSYAQDILEGTAETTITTQELMDLVEENEELLEQTFDVEITEKMKQDLHLQLEQIVEEEDINGTIRQEIHNVMEQPLPGTDATISDLMEEIQHLAQPKVLALAAGLCLLLMLLMMLVNYYNVPAGVHKCGAACLTPGILLAVPLLLAQFAEKVLLRMMPESRTLLQAAHGAFRAVAPIHYGLPLLGIALIVLGFVLRIFHTKE